MRRFLVFAAAGALVLGCTDNASVLQPTFSSASGTANAADAAGRRYEVTIENLTSSQPLSPGVVVTHTAQSSVFHVGSAASEGVRLIAENGDPSVAVGALDGADGIHQVVATPHPVGCIGCGGPFSTSLTLDVEAGADANRLSVAVMLICTNDGFVGLDGVRLPGGFAPVTYEAVAYDAGTEANDERFTSLVDPCGAIGPVAVPPDGSNSRTATSAPVAHHPGIQGGGDLDPATYGWNDPVARITVRRVR